MKKVYVNAEKTVKQAENFWNHIHFHPTDAIEDDWGTDYDVVVIAGNFLMNIVSEVPAVFLS